MGLVLTVGLTDSSPLSAACCAHLLTNEMCFKWLLIICQTHDGCKCLMCRVCRGVLEAADGPESNG